MKHLKYLKYIITHKWWVMVAGIRFGAPIFRLIIHDWTKLTPQEWGPYANLFYSRHSKLNPPRDLQSSFDAAWLHHQSSNKHHWQYWVLIQDDGEIRPLEIPFGYVLEMVSDWAGAGKTITGRWDLVVWYNKNKNSMRLHKNTRFLVEMIIGRADELLSGH